MVQRRVEHQVADGDVLRTVVLEQQLVAAADPAGKRPSVYRRL